MPYVPPKATFVAGPLYVEQIGELQIITDKFSKRQMVLTDRDEKYPLHLAVIFTRKDTGKCDLVRVGDLVEVRGELRGREWNGRYYVDVIAHEVHRADAAPATLPGMGLPPAAPSPDGRAPSRPLPDHLQPAAANTDLADELPF